VIHPQSIIDPAARLGTNVQIGAFSIIGPDVEIGDDCWIGPHVVINGPTKIGKNNRIFQFASIGEAPQDLKYAGEPTHLEIGDRNVIREYVTMSRGTVGGGGITHVGSDSLFMAYVHIAHDCHVGNKVVFANNATLAGHVEVGDNTVLGGFVGIHQFCKVGAGVMMGVGSVALKDVPPFLMVYGNPAEPNGLNLRGLKRRGASIETIDAMKKAYKTVFRSGLTVAVAAEALREPAARFPEVATFLSFVQNAQRGIIR
jgi:UDP-N-acetylglucosamine acyltransferase